MKPDKHLAAAAGIILAATGLIALTWIGMLRAVHLQSQESAARVSTTLQNEALSLAEQISRQLIALDQTLRMLVFARESDPNGFDLEAWRTRAVVLTGISRDMVLTDRGGIVRQSSVIPAIEADVSQLDFFRVLAASVTASTDMFIGPATTGTIMRQWHLDVARPLHAPDGSFAGVIDADYRISAITDIFRQTDLGRAGFATLVGLEDGKMRGTVGSANIDPDLSIADTRMFAAIQRGESGEWTGPSAIDPARRIHAYRRIADRPLVLVVAIDEAEALRPTDMFRGQAEVVAGCITALLASVAALLVSGLRRERLRERTMAEDQATLAAAIVQLEVARALVTAKAERLEATLAGMTDGVSMFDGNLCLVEWNARFPEIAGVPPGMLRVGLPMEEVLRAQAASGQFGHVADPEREVERRIARVRETPLAVVQRPTPDGRMSQMPARKLAIRPSLFDLHHLLDRSVEVFALQAAERGITLRVAVAARSPAKLLTDPARLRQVLLNLLSNALKYAQPGDVWLTAEPEGDGSRAVTLMVKDSGPIIAQAARERLFRPFSRLDRPESEALDGTDLGLSMCHHLMTLMGGEIGCDPWVADDGRTGNAFWISLPAAALPLHVATDRSPQTEVLMAVRSAEAPGLRGVSTRAHGAQALRPPVPRTRVLLADDILANQLVTATLLRRDGHMVDVVESGQAAIDAVRRNPYDLVFMDIFMPGMDGQEAARIIRSLPEPANLTPIIALTANVTPEHEAVFRSAGMNGILGKPVSAAELLAVLRTRVWSGSGIKPALPAEAPVRPPLHDPRAVLSHARIRELRTALAPETFVNLVEECLSDLVLRLPELRRAVTSANTGAITTLAHAMVGMAAGYGMAALETRLRTILAAAREGDTQTLSGPVVAEIEADLTEAARMLRELSQSETA